jgi:3-methyl-2-oxobutanoate hydroxymethyltransferase
MKSWTTTKITACKGQQKIACLTAADYATARRIDEAGLPLILVGDSLAMTVLGYETTLPVSVDEMLHHTFAVVRGVKNALVVADMPFMSYQVSPQQALENAGRFLKDAHADAVKIEGGRMRVETIKLLIANGIPVMGHIGLTPQSVRQMGGYKVQGRKPDQAQALIDDAMALEEAGVFALVLECVPRQLAAEITEKVSVPTIGIGAGPDCDGQILVTHDMLGMHADLAPSFVKRYAELGSAMQQAFGEYRREVEQSIYPTEDHSF